MLENIGSEVELTTLQLSNAKLIGKINESILLVLCRDERNSSENEETRKNALIVAIDQHAAHERVLLEKSLSAFERLSSKPTDFCGRRFFSSVPVNLEVPTILGKLMNGLSPDVREKLFKILKSLGFKFCIGTYKQNVITISRLPNVLFLNGNLISGSETAVMQLLKDVTLMPKLEKKLIYSSFKEMCYPYMQLRACRSAIQFGDILNKQEVLELLRSLSHCRLPFKCAHGRPTCVPIAELSI
ncbi:unnamed protein product [Dicrocoelium dendriticum]|nr:unnamed protein product [Dicrocoelium dendriticum]